MQAPFWDAYFHRFEFKGLTGFSWTIVIRRQPSQLTWVLALTAAVRHCRRHHLLLVWSRAPEGGRASYRLSRSLAKAKATRKPPTKWPQSHATRVVQTHTANETS